MKKLQLGALGVTAFALANTASAAIDVTDAVAEFTGAAAPIAALGGAALLVVVMIKVYKKIRGAA